MTVLYNLRKLKHPRLRNVWLSKKNRKSENPIYHNKDFSYQWKLVNSTEDSLCLVMVFGYSDKRYEFQLRKKMCNISYKLRERDESGHLSVNQKLLIENIEYDNLDAALFQQSLLTECGMIGNQEIELLKELAVLYFEEPQ